ncbi:MAG: capsular biosynthesis protein, partial [Chryseobacterium sp.]
GIIPPNPVELLDNGRYKILIEKAKELYDYILIDSAPLMPVTDTYIIAKLADVSLYIMRSGKTERSYIEYADHTVSEKKLNKVNIVLNDVTAENFGYGNQKGYGYNHDVDDTFFGKIKSWFSKS